MRSFSFYMIGTISSHQSLDIEVSRTGHYYLKKNYDNDAVMSKRLWKNMSCDSSAASSKGVSIVLRQTRRKPRSSVAKLCKLM